MRILYYDCFAGISGDMNLGAMIDLGVDPNYLIAEFQKLNIEGFHLEVQERHPSGDLGNQSNRGYRKSGERKAPSLAACGRIGQPKQSFVGSQIPFT